MKEQIKTEDLDIEKIAKKQEPEEKITLKFVNSKNEQKKEPPKRILENNEETSGEKRVKMALMIATVLILFSVSVFFGILALNDKFKDSSSVNNNIVPSDINNTINNAFQENNTNINNNNYTIVNNLYLSDDVINAIADKIIKNLTNST